MLCKLGLNWIMCSMEASIGGIFYNSYWMFRLGSVCGIIIGSVDILRWWVELFGLVFEFGYLADKTFNIF